MQKKKYLHLAKLIRQRRTNRQAKSPVPVPSGQNLDTWSTVEIIAFFTGVAIVFSLINALFLQQFMQFDEFVYGLTFANESFSLKKIIYYLAALFAPLSILLAVLCSPIMHQSKKSQSVRNKNALYSLFKKYQQKIWQRILLFLLIVIPVFLYIVCIYNKYISDNTRFIISTGYIFVASLISIFFIKCTIPCRALLFFTFFMISSWVYISFSTRSTNKDIPVIITLQDNSTIDAMHCMISKEGLAVLKDSKGTERIIPLSLIKEIIGKPKPAQNSTTSPESASKKQEKKAGGKDAVQ